MYTSKTSYRDEDMYTTARNLHKCTPSFSSTLLDEIYRSIGGSEEKSGDFKVASEKPAKRHGGGYRTKINIIEEGDDDDRGGLTKARLVEKWIQNEIIEKAVASRSVLANLEMQNSGDLVFFSSTSSSNSDSSGALSSSDTEFFSSQREPKVSCFSTWPKPTRTGGAFPASEIDKTSRSDFIGGAKNRIGDDDRLVKHKSRALQLYSNLKKMKQPISPGGRLTSFINSIFSNSSGKNSKNTESNSYSLRDPKPLRESKSACSSAASFSRSCLNQYSPGSSEKTGGGAHRAVTFHPATVIIDEGSRLCLEKCRYGEGGAAHGKSPSPSVSALGGLKRGKNENIRKFEVGVKSEIKGHIGNNKMDDYDGISDSSSDLFELDHLRFCEELPVYETTRLDVNRVIADCSIRK